MLIMAFEGPFHANKKATPESGRQQVASNK